jgi:SulP family sulfate permease
VTLVVALAARRLWPRIPPMIVAMVAGKPLRLGPVAGGHRDRAEPSGALAAGLPPLSLPSFDPDTWARSCPAALALTVLGLTRPCRSRARWRCRTGQAHRRQPGVRRPGPVEPRRRFFSATLVGQLHRSGVNLEAGARSAARGDRVRRACSR